MSLVDLYQEHTFPRDTVMRNVAILALSSVGIPVEPRLTMTTGQYYLASCSCPSLSPAVPAHTRVKTFIHKSRPHRLLKTQKARGTLTP